MPQTTSTKPRVTFQDLPLEIIFNIFNILLFSYQRKEYSRPYCPKTEDQAHIPPFQWILPSIALHSRSLSRFPYNVDAVCRVWHAVLTRIPECWTRVGFDVAKDVTMEVLDSFLWSKRIPKIEVHVFTTASRPGEVDSSLESRRVSAIVNALRPHIHRCKSIVFDVMFSTSLPPPVVFLEQEAPDLERLVLDCQVDNITDPRRFSDICDIGVHDFVDPKPSITLPKLRHISITGFWFMRTFNHPYTTTVLERLPCSSLSVTRFHFRDEGIYTLRHFISYFTRMCQFPSALHFRGLSLNYPHDQPFTRQVSLYGVFTHLNHRLEDMTFYDVSADCISTIFALTNVCPLSLHFERCILPSEISWDGVQCPISFSHIDDIQLVNPHSSPGGSTAPDINTATHKGNLLAGWSGARLTLTSCRIFDDTFIDSLRALDLKTLKHLILQDCGNFSATSLCRYIQARNKRWVDVDHPDVAPNPSETHPLHSVHVSGDCAFPSNREQLWVRQSGYTEPTSIRWASSRFEDGVRIVESSRYHGYDSD